MSETAVRRARERHPGSPVQYHVADLLDLSPEWMHASDLVVEIMTVQALPEPPRHSAIVNVGRRVAPGGILLAIAAHPDDGPAEPGPPWPLTRAEIDLFAADHLSVVLVEARSGRWVAEFTRPSP